MPAATHAPELLAPAGDWPCVRAAVANGADAVYLGLPRFNARLRADNFTAEQFPKVVAFCRARGVKTYVAFNTLVFTAELDDAEAYLRFLSAAGADAIIVQDVGLALLAREIVPDLPVHASTQMTVTSPEGLEAARSLGIRRAVLARETSLRELAKFDPSFPLEVFVHGALCVAYSGQCLTSEVLGERSANRGECAQACRMEYRLIVDGSPRDLGDRRYLLSPQDLAAIDEIPALLRLGVSAFKIEGRLKSPEYVAAVTAAYRKALDAALANHPSPVTADDRYRLEMTFSRGLFTGWMHGVNHQRLVPATHGKKRGPFIGHVARFGRDWAELDDTATPLKPGDGVVFDTGENTDAEQGGRLYAVEGRTLRFARGHLDPTRLRAGARVWKTSDPALERDLRATFAADPKTRRPRPLDLVVRGREGEPLELSASGITLLSRIPLARATTAPLTPDRLREHLGRFGGSPFALRDLRAHLEGDLILPIAELNRLRRDLVARLMEPAARRERPASHRDVARTIPCVPAPPAQPRLHVLCREMEQLDAALGAGATSVYADFEDIRRYREAVALTRKFPAARIALATPRIQKAGEGGFFKLIASHAPDAVLIRNLGAIRFFENAPLEKIGDFSLNIANPLSARWFRSLGLDRLTASYDLDPTQALDLLRAGPDLPIEMTVHQHIPMFHMEHCVFAAFLSRGTDHTNCGRPCDRHRVHLLDRIGIEHPLRADVGCRNTLFHADAQTGAPHLARFLAAGLRHARIELLEESPDETRRTVHAYAALLRDPADPAWRDLRAKPQLGVTRNSRIP